MNELRQKYPLKMLLKVLKLSKSSYFYQVNALKKEDKDAGIKAEIKAIFTKNKGRYGYRRIYIVLRSTRMVINHKKVKRLMKELNLYGVTPKAKYKSYKGDQNGTVKNQLLVKEVDEEKHKATYKRDFSTTKCNEKWTTDVSEFHIAAGKLYLSPILDMHNGEIVSYNISRSPNFAQTLDMLDEAFKRHENLEGLIFHSDQGWQYQMRPYHERLEEKGIIQSMSRKGNCLDNCVMENFFGKMKNEMFYGHEYEFATLDELEVAMHEYIKYYNEERIQVKLKGLTPVQYRNQAL